MDNNIKKILDECYYDTIEEISSYCNNIKRINREKELNDKYAENAKLVGKCYRKNNTFYKVVSVKSNNEYRISCLTFDEHPSAEFRKLLQLGWSHPNEGAIEFDGIYLSDPMVKDIINWDEISEESYNKYLDEYIASLKSFNWEDV